MTNDNYVWYPTKMPPRPIFEVNNAGTGAPDSVNHSYLARGSDLLRDEQGRLIIIDGLIPK